MFPGGERQGYLEKAGSTGGDKKKKKKIHEADPCRAGCIWRLHAWACSKLTQRSETLGGGGRVAEAKSVFKKHQDESPESSNMFGRKRQELW